MMDELNIYEHRLMLLDAEDTLHKFRVIDCSECAALVLEDQWKKHMRWHKR